MSFGDTPYPGIQKYVPGQEVVIPLLVRAATRPANLARQFDDPLFDPNLGVTYSVYYGQDRTPTLVQDYPMIRISKGLYQGSYVTWPDDPIGAYDVEAVATHGSLVQRTYYRAAFWLVEE